MENNAPIVEKTAVETLIHMLFVKKMFNEVNYNHTEAEELREIFDFANELFKKQIMNAHNDGTKRQIENSELYYNETFKSE